MKFSIDPLTRDSFPAFVDVLRSRGETPVDYYRWKYMSRNTLNPNIPRGFLACVDNKFVGCIGVITREWKDLKGNTFPATWLADWFVHPMYQGIGIGQALIQEVQRIASISIFMPGTAAARAVASKAGYYQIAEIIEEVKVIRPWQYGWLRYGGKYYKRVFRAIREMIKFPMIKRVRSKSLKLKFEFPEESFWDDHLFLDDVPQLVDSPEFLNWLRAMPNSGQDNPKIWWYWHQDNQKVFGFIEKDQWDIKRCRVLDTSKTFEQNVTSLGSSLITTLQNLGVTYIESFGALHFYGALAKKVIPIYATKEIDIVGTAIRGIDRENWYRDLRFSNLG